MYFNWRKKKDQGMIKLIRNLLGFKAQEKKINYVWLYMMSHQNIGVIGVSARNRHNLVKGPDNG